jgi:ribosomal-protein-alanine N-acetyltransferase
LKVRPADLHDLEAIAQVEATAGATGWSTDMIRKTLADPHTQAWLTSGAPCRGYLLARLVIDNGEILNLCVVPDHRRKGLARALLSTCLEAWDEQGVVAGHLEVASQNHAAHRLYVSSGWKPCGLRSKYYTNGDDAVQMIWHPND